MKKWKNVKTKKRKNEKTKINIKEYKKIRWTKKKYMYTYQCIGPYETNLRHQTYDFLFTYDIFDE